MNLKDVRDKLNTINKIVDEHLDFLLEIRQDEKLYNDDIDEIGQMADDVLSTLTKHSDLLRAPAGGEEDWVCGFGRPQSGLGLRISPGPAWSSRFSPNSVKCGIALWTC